MTIEECDLTALEDNQRSEVRFKPLPRRTLGRGTTALLIALRVYVGGAGLVIVLALAKAGHL